MSLGPLLALILGLACMTRARPTVTYLSINSEISFRFASTHVTSRLTNNEQQATEAVFKVVLPNTAFMSNFSMNINGQVIYGQVKDKEAAKRQYEQAKGQGQTAGHVGTTARDSNTFEVLVNIAARKSAEFDLYYQEVLQRRLGHYEHAINIDPGQVVPGLKVIVNINESRPIEKLSVPPIAKLDQAADISKTSPQNMDAIVTRHSDRAVTIRYAPSAAAQKQGISGQFIVRYDVRRGLDTGDIQVVNGYFVHALAPAGLPPIPKNILFILDTSGSMSGRKIRQLHEAMYTILEDVRHEDTFNLLSFASSIKFWHREMLNVNDSTIREARQFVARMQASGMTAINDALTRGIANLNNQAKKFTERPSIIIFLTDGMPTIGVTDTETILRNVRNANKAQYPIFALGFGNGVNFDFLKKLSSQNSGLARKIYEASDATLQLQNFYQEVSIPLLSDVNITYETDGGQVTEVTKHKFKTFFSGGEMLVAGKLRAPNLRRIIIRPCFWGHTITGRIHICPPWPWPPVVRPTWAPETGLAAYVERMWAYLTIQQLLDRKLRAHSDSEKERLKNEALKLSLQFSFVTPLTSMVVTLPNKPNSNLGGLNENKNKPTVSRPSGSRGWWGGGGLRFRKSFRIRMVRPQISRPNGGSGGWGSAGVGTAPPMTTKAPVVAAPSMAVVLPSDNTTICLAWPQMALSAHSLLKDRGVEIRVRHGQKGAVQSVTISSSGTTQIVTPTHMLLDGQLRPWRQAYSSSTVSVDGVKATFRPVSGISLVAELNDKASPPVLLLTFDDLSGVSAHATAMLKNVKSWRHQRNVLSTEGGRQYTTSSLTMGQLNCHAPAQDIFVVTNTPSRA